MRMQDYVRYSSTKLRENFEKRDELVDQVSNFFQKDKYHSLTLIASGSSYNSVAMVKDSLQAIIRLPVNLYTPEYVLEFGIINCKSSFVIVISQSGSSTNIIDCLKYLRNKKIFSISLSGNVNSEMAKFSPEIFNYGPGNEYIDYVTTGVQTLVEFLLLLSCKLSDFSAEQITNFEQQFREAISYQKRLLSITDNFIQQNYLKLSMNSPTFFCGNGPNYGVAKEGALKFQETLKRPAMYYELEEFLHGPDMQLTPNYTVFLIDDMATKNSSRFAEVFSALKKITTNVFFITSSKQFATDERVLQTESANNWVFAPYYSLPVVQLIAAIMSDELKTWDTHPYFDEFDKKIAIKTADYDDEINKIREKWESESK